MRRSRAIQPWWQSCRARGIFSCRRCGFCRSARSWCCRAVRFTMGPPPRSLRAPSCCTARPGASLGTPAVTQSTPARRTPSSMPAMQQWRHASCRASRAVPPRRRRTARCAAGFGRSGRCVARPCHRCGLRGPRHAALHPLTTTTAPSPCPLCPLPPTPPPRHLAWSSSSACLDAQRTWSAASRSATVCTHSHSPTRRTT